MLQKTIFITGGSGYIGAMLVDQFAGRDDVAHIVTLDKEPETELTKNHPNKDKITFIQDNLCNNTWQEKVRVHSPSIVVHTAWQIRPLYGEEGKATTWSWNVVGSEHVFDFVFRNNIQKLVYFSTVASYGAFAENTTTHYFTEDEPFRTSEYLYAEEKRIVEGSLKALYEKAKEDGYTGSVSIVRPAAISGPRGRYSRIRFGLQSALSGSLKGSPVYTIIRGLVFFVPATAKWIRQFIHEDDVLHIVETLVFSGKEPAKYEVFNICPPGEPVFARDMAAAVGKKILPIYPWMARLAFFFFWHATRGRVPTCKGAWRGYSYPIVVDGSKLTRDYGYVYTYTSKDAFTTKSGIYEVKETREL